MERTPPIADIDLSITLQKKRSEEICFICKNTLTPIHYVLGFASENSHLLYSDEACFNALLAIGWTYFEKIYFPQKSDGVKH